MRMRIASICSTRVVAISAVMHESGTQRLLGGSSSWIVATVDRREHAEARLGHGPLAVYHPAHSRLLALQTRPIAAITPSSTGDGSLWSLARSASARALALPPSVLGDANCCHTLVHEHGSGAVFADVPNR